LEITTADLVLLPLPLYHSNGLGTVRTYLKEGASIILLDGVMSVNYIKKMLLRYPCSAFSCSPVMLEVLDMLTDGEYVNLFQNLRYIEIGTAPVTERLRQILRERFPRQRLFINYGATESPRAVYMDLNCQEYKKLESIGQTIGDYDAIVLDDDNTIISERNRIGKLALGGRAIMQGYWNNDHLTKQVLVGSHYLTGDMAYIDKDNYVYLQGRIHDLIIIGGEKVFPNEIERMLLEMPDIYECAVIGVEYTRHFVGQQPVAFVVMKKNAVFQMELINKYLESKLELFKIPNKIISIDQLPRNIMGKVDRNSLRKMLERM
jgi:long-chain acyl-CoA synthetase